MRQLHVTCPAFFGPLRLASPLSGFGVMALGARALDHVRRERPEHRTELHVEVVARDGIDHASVLPGDDDPPVSRVNPVGIAVPVAGASFARRL